MIPLPVSPYAVAKLACEGYCRSFSEVYGLETVSLRYFKSSDRGRIRSRTTRQPSRGSSLGSCGANA
jgi:nucleoside-diphosphate-sugar epimerase